MDIQQGHSEQLGTKWGSRRLTALEFKQSFDAVWTHMCFQCDLKSQTRHLSVVDGKVGEGDINAATDSALHRVVVERQPG